MKRTSLIRKLPKMPITRSAVPDEASFLQDLRVRLARYQDLYDRAPVGYLTLDGAGRILQINQTGSSMLSRVRDNPIGLQLSEFFEGPSRMNMAALMTSSARQMIPQSEEFSLLGQHALQRQCLRVEVLYDRGANEYRVVMSDVTERHALEEELVNMGHREQLRLGTALQDGLGQELAGLSLSMSAMLRDSQRGMPPKFSELRQCQESILGTMSSCLALARDVAPLAAFQGGISQALRDLVASSQSRVAAAVALNITESAPVTLPIANCDHLFRIASEALNNACLHSQANNIQMNFRVRRRTIMLTVSDDGCGLGDVKETLGLGLRVMRYRARLIGAHMSIISAPARGTLVECSCRQLAA